jgi:hypothetical protein
MSVRVLSTWGTYAGLDCDCLTSHVFVATNLDGEELRLFQLGPLLDPVVDSLVTEASKPTVYLSYGLAAQRLHLRVGIALDRLSITSAAPH